MRKIKFAFILIAGCSLFTACVNPNESKPADTPAADNSRTSLDWHGVYTGVLPCADCEGMETMLRINEDMTYVLETTYLGKSNEIHAQKGTFSWNDAGNTIALSSLDPNEKLATYAVGENKLTQLDREGKAITGDLESKYILTKVDADIVEEYWKLIELNGSPIAPKPNGGRESHMLLKAANGNVAGNGGCNSFRGGFILEDGNRIRFTQVAATKMACDNLPIETKFFEALSMTEMYSVDNDTLSIQKSDSTSLAKFIAVRVQ